jgi:thioredoxin 1
LKTDLKKIVPRAIFLLVLLFLIAGCAENNNTKKAPLSPVVKAAPEKPAVVEPSAVKPVKTIKVTFIELGSAGCVPCEMMKPVMKEIEDKYRDRVKVIFYDVRTPEGAPYAQKYGVRVIPTQVFLDENGEEYYRHIGFFPVDEVEKILELRGVE